MTNSHLTDTLFDFVKKNINAETNRLRLKLLSGKKDPELDFAILQIESRNKTSKKLSRFLSYDKFVFPAAISAEQASHQAVGAYHASLFPSSKTALDMTAGLGIDAFSFAMSGKAVTACEIDPDKCVALRHNASVLSLGSIKVAEGDSVRFIEEASEKYDLIFIDPARRGKDNKRMYNFHDCLPDIIELQDIIKQHTEILAIKSSPLLDITQTLRDIQDVAEIHVVGVEGECKEILVVVKKGSERIRFKAIDLSQDGEINFSFSYIPSEDHSPITYLSSKEDVASYKYLYEPNSCVMKLSPWEEMTDAFPELRKLGRDSHLFVSNTYYGNFPGRIMEIERELKGKDRKALKGVPVNIVARNYPLKADQLRQQIGAKEGKERFLYATRIGSTPVMLLCVRLNRDQKR